MPVSNATRIPLDILDTDDDAAVVAYIKHLDATTVEGLSEASRSALSNGGAPIIKRIALQELATRLLDAQRLQALDKHPEAIEVLGYTSAMNTPLEIPATLEQLRDLEGMLDQLGDLISRSSANQAVESRRGELFEDPSDNIKFLTSKLDRGKQNLCFHPLPLDASRDMRGQLEKIIKAIEQQLAEIEPLSVDLERRRLVSLEAHGRTIQHHVSGPALMLMMAQVTPNTPLREMGLLGATLDDLDLILEANDKFHGIVRRLEELRKQYPSASEHLSGAYRHLMWDDLDDQINYMLSQRIARSRAAAIDKILESLGRLEPELVAMDAKVADAASSVQETLDAAVAAHEEIMRDHSARIEYENEGHAKKTMKVGPQAMFYEMVVRGSNPQGAAERIQQMMESKLSIYRERAELQISAATKPASAGSQERREQERRRRDRSQRDREATARRKGPSPGAAKFGPGKQRRKK